MCPRIYWTKIDHASSYHILSGEDTSSTNINHCILILLEVCRSVCIGPPCIGWICDIWKSLVIGKYNSNNSPNNGMRYGLCFRLTVNSLLLAMLLLWPLIKYYSISRASVLSCIATIFVCNYILTNSITSPVLYASTPASSSVSTLHVSAAALALTKCLGSLSRVEAWTRHSKKHGHFQCWKLVKIVMLFDFIYNSDLMVFKKIINAVKGIVQ